MSNILVANSLLRATRKHETHDTPVRSIIRKVNYGTRHLQVSRQGAYIRHVKVQQGIQLGTVTHKIVNVGDVAMLRRDPLTHKWLCVEIRTKVRCASGNAPASEVEVDTSAEVSYTATVQQTPALELTPESLFLPPIEPLGLLSINSSATYDIGGGYAGSFSATIQQNIGLANGSIWSKYHVSMTGSAGWEIVLNGSIIASGSGSYSGTFATPVSFLGGSKVSFAIVSGSGSDLFWDVGV